MKLHEVFIHGLPYDFERNLLGRHGSASLCRVERKNKMAATYNVLADISPGDEFYTSEDT